MESKPAKDFEFDDGKVNTSQAIKKWLTEKFLWAAWHFGMY